MNPISRRYSIGTICVMCVRGEKHRYIEPQRSQARIQFSFC